MSSAFHEQLSIDLPPNHWQLAIPGTSGYSQSSTIASSSQFSFGQSNTKNPMNPMSFSPIEDLEDALPTSNQQDRLNSHISDIRRSDSDGPDPPNPRVERRRLEKPRRSRQFSTLNHDTRVRKRQQLLRCLVSSLVLILVLLIGNVVFLNIRVLSPSTTKSRTTSTTNALSADAQRCLSEYSVNAPFSPHNYPCSTCSSVLQAVPPSYMSSSAHAQDTQLINNAMQFCSLRAIYEAANARGQARLGNGSWAQSVNFCTWVGVSCDASGHVTSLNLTYPGVPVKLPNEIGGLTALQTLDIIGGNSTPAGSLPSSFTNLTSLTTLHLEATSITALPSSLFVPPGLTRLSTLALIRNLQMGTTLPSSLTNLMGLQNLVVNSQALPPSQLATLTGSSSLAASLRTLDLTSTSLSGSIPGALTSFKYLTQLLLGSNNLTGDVPTLPSTLRILELNGNSGLGGSIACTSATLAQCSLQGTSISSAGCCVCQDATMMNGSQ